MQKKHNSSALAMEFILFWFDSSGPSETCASVTYEQFSLQPAHPCFKINLVGSSGKFSYMFIVYMMIG